eukprot:TRINITY_DN25506_c0_g1_i1.p1 TRINITY_DN25506_c0_g1~~TRINITY_DN25506_c0_g1_i1.p1  ORF type:complete len:124 (+),score=24.10 TRINITY_DN25506_c0_g1_i1:41-373(+)
MVKQDIFTLSPQFSFVEEECYLVLEKELDVASAMELPYAGSETQTAAGTPQQDWEDVLTLEIPELPLVNEMDLESAVYSSVASSSDSTSSSSGSIYAAVAVRSLARLLGK